MSSAKEPKELDSYIFYPATIVEFTRELIKVIDDYRARKLTNIQVKEIITFYATVHPDKFFDGQNYNKTVTRFLGVSRIKVVDALLTNYQTKIE